MTPRRSKAIGPLFVLKLSRDNAGARHVKLYLLLGAGPTRSGPPAILDIITKLLLPSFLVIFLAPSFQFKITYAAYSPVAGW